MYHALQLHEILLNIFGHCALPRSHWTPDRRRYTADLAALARTCRTFKEPALDVLWSEQVDLTPLPRCLPEVRLFFCGIYSFRRRLKRKEWDTLLSYTRRIWMICSHTSNPDGWLDHENLITTCGSANLARLLFPNLHSLFWRGPLIPAVHVAVPSLTRLDLQLTVITSESALTEFLTSIGDHCPNLIKARIDMFGTSSDTLRESIYYQISRWKRLERLDLRGYAVTSDMVSQLCQCPSLMYLGLTLTLGNTDRIIDPGSFSIFSTLTCLEITSECGSLHAVTSFLSCIRLPMLDHLLVMYPRRISRDEFRSYVSMVRKVCSPDRLTNFIFFNYVRSHPKVDNSAWDGQLTLDDLRQLMEFVHLRQIRLDLKWSVCLTDRDMLTLVSAWPQARSLRLNDTRGWRAPQGGVTLRGLVRLARKRPSLEMLCVALQTASCMMHPGSDDELAYDSETDTDVTISSGTVLKSLRVHVPDAPIRAQGVPGLMDAFVGLRRHVAFVSDNDGCEWTGCCTR